MNKFAHLACWVLSFGSAGLALLANAASPARGMMRGVGARIAMLSQQEADNPAITDGRIVFFSGEKNVSPNDWIDVESQWRVAAGNPSGIIITNNSVWFKSSYYCGAAPSVLSNALASANYSILIVVDELQNGPARTVFSARMDKKSEFELSLKGGGNGRLALDVAGKTCLNVKLKPSARVFLLSVENGVATVYADGVFVEGPAARPIPQILLPTAMPFAIGGDFAASGLKIRSLAFYNKSKTADEAKAIYKSIIKD